MHTTCLLVHLFTVYSTNLDKLPVAKYIHYI